MPAIHLTIKQSLWIIQKFYPTLVFNIIAYLFLSRYALIGFPLNNEYIYGFYIFSLIQSYSIAFLLPRGDLNFRLFNQKTHEVIVFSLLISLYAACLFKGYFSPYELYAFLLLKVALYSHMFSIFKSNFESVLRRLKKANIPLRYFSGFTTIALLKSLMLAVLTYLIFFLLSQFLENDLKRSDLLLLLTFAYLLPMRLLFFLSNFKPLF